MVTRDYDVISWFQVIRNTIQFISSKSMKQLYYGKEKE